MNIRPSTELKIENGFLRFLNLVVGLVLMGGGLVGANQTLEHAKDGHADHVLIYVFVGLAVLGALMLPGIFSVVKPIFVLIFPNGIPLIGGRRQGDPQKPEG